MKRYKSTTILGGGPPGKIVQCQSFQSLISRTYSIYYYSIYYYIIPGTHAFNSGTGNDVFFADDGFKFHTGMNLNDGQRIDLEDNKNIL